MGYRLSIASCVGAFLDELEKIADIAPAHPRTLLARKEAPKKSEAITGPNVELYRAQSPSNLVGSVVKKFPIRGDVGKDKAYLSYKGRF